MDLMKKKYQILLGIGILLPIISCVFYYSFILILIGYGLIIFSLIKEKLEPKKSIRIFVILLMVSILVTIIGYLILVSDPNNFRYLPKEYVLSHFFLRLFYSLINGIAIEAYIFLLNAMLSKPKENQIENQEKKEEDEKQETKKPKIWLWIILEIIGFIPWILLLAISISSIWTGFSFMNTSYGWDAFVGSLILLGTIGSPLLIIGAILVIISTINLIKIKKRNSR